MYAVYAMSEVVPLRPYGNCCFMPEIIHTPSFDLAYRFVTETDLNIFLTGKAGTGKTTFLKYLREACVKNMVVAAPTGVAAINAGGVTLHSLFQLPFAPFIPAPARIIPERRIDREENVQPAVTSHSLLSQIHYNKQKLNLFRNLELLIIDEASMVPSHTVDAIDAILKSVRRIHGRPFGGVQVLFIGDLYQLPPVVKKQEWEILSEFYSSVFFFDSLALRENVPVMIELKDIFRQRDLNFINLLNEIRNNCLTPGKLDLLNSRLKRNFVPGNGDGYITLTTHNYQADEINKKKLDKLPGNSQMFSAEIMDDFPEHLYPAEPELKLKIGAQVMFLRNDTEGKTYFNGKIGVITHLLDNEIHVRCQGEQNEIEVKKHEWKNINYSLEPNTREIIEEEQGSFVQYPLRLAWAITIHKSQGLTFDKMVIDAERAFATGQVYVALSRCTAIEGLILTTPVNSRFLGAHQNLKAWEEKNNDEQILPGKFTEARKQYILRELENIFTWKNWYFELKDMEKIISECRDGLPPECMTWIAGLLTQEKIIYEVVVRFRKRMAELSAYGPDAESNEPLQKRIKEAANYFFDVITAWAQKFRGHPLLTDTRKTARKIDAALNEINIVLNEIIQRLNFCKKGFVLNDYLQLAIRPVSESERVQSSYDTGIRSKKTSSVELVHPVLYENIAGMRNRIVRETNLPLYMVFSNKAIKNVCGNLPLSKDALLAVNGFGNVKVATYGDEVIMLVRQYCDEHNISPAQVYKKTKRKEASSPSR